MSMRNVSARRQIWPPPALVFMYINYPYLHFRGRARAFPGAE